MIIEQVYANKEKKIKQSPVNSNRASDLGIPCVKYHVLNRTRWSERSLHNASLQMTFDIGSILEEVVLRDLQDAGFQIIEQQRAFSWPEYQITGHLDAKVVIDGEAIPVEVKTASPYVYKTINSIQDLTNGKYSYLRKYPAQLTLYCLLGNHERGMFIFKDKSSGAMKELFMPLDYDLGETLLKRAESVNQHIKDGTVPEGINNDLWCSGCAFAHICLPVQVGKEVEIDTGELATLLDRMEELKPAVDEYNELDDQVKALTEGKDKILAGDWFVTGKWYERKSYEVPAEIKAQYEKVTKYWRRKVEKVGLQKKTA